MRSLYQARAASRRLGVVPVMRRSFAKMTGRAPVHLGKINICLAFKTAASLVYLPILLAVLAIAGSTHRALGQATSGSISGFITDGSGAAIPQAKVSVQDEGTGVNTQAATDGSGFYNVTHIIAGNYTVTVTANGFKTFSKQHIQLQIDSAVRADAKLEPGTLTEQVVVTAVPAALKTERADVDHLLDQHELETIPVVDDNLTTLYTTAPGVVPFSFQISTNENPSEGFMTSVNGQLWMANDYQVDGITDIAWGFTGLQIIVPPPDSVQELKITTANYDPEYGSVGGMVAQYDTKSGTNDFHGSAYWMNRNAWSFAANPFTETIPGTGPQGRGTGVAPYNENIGGVAIGGPIKKNKVFFFADYRLNRRLVGANLLTTVPNDAFRNGDFSAVAATDPIYDPTTGNPDGSGRALFPNNTIPANRINPVATNLLAILPHANISQATQNNYLGTGKSPFNTDEIDERVDWNFSDKDKFFERYSYMWSYFSNPSVFGVAAGGPSIAGGNASTANSWNQLLSMNYTHAFTPTLLAEVRAGFARFYLNEYQNDASLETNNKVGIPNINQGSSLTGGLAAIEVAGPVGSWTMGTQGSVPRLDRSTVFQLVNNWTKVAGNHEIRWGADIRWNFEDLFTLNQSTRGEFDFNQTVTGSADAPDSGNSTASFLLAGAGSFERGQFILWPDERATRISGYGGDSWKPTPKLTLNYGLRWDYISPISPKNPGGDVNYDFDNGSLILAGLGNISKYSNVQPRYNNFAPRLGFAYLLTEKTVIRGGLGRSYFINGFDAAFNHLDSSYPVAQAQAVDQSSLYTPIFPMNEGPPAPPAPVFPASGIIPASQVPANDFAKAWYPERKTSSVDSWNLSIQRQLGADTTLTVAYVGNKGNNLDYSFYNIDAAPPAPGDLLTRRPLYIKFGFTGQMYLNCTCDDSNYNAVQITGVKRFTKNYSFHSAFTYAKALDDEIGARGPQGGNPYDLKGSYGVSYLNQAVIWTTTHSILIPFGKGQRFGSNTNQIAQDLLGGWTFDGITTLQSGLALSPTDSDSSTLNADFSQRPNRIPNVSLSPKEKNRHLWLNPAAFVTPPVCCVWGNASPGSMRGPAYYDLDWALGRTFGFKTPLNADLTQLQFRLESFNLLNHTNLGQPTNDINNPQFGLINGITGNMRNLQFDLHLRW
jgi:hypothetical protein